MKKVFILFLGIILFLSGCILEYREELPAKIVISEMPKPEPESIYCENPPCATLVQLTQIKRTEYVCSPTYKGANDDPQGVIYKTELGDICTPLDKPTTVCLKYDCDFNEEENIGYYDIDVKFSRTYTSFDGGKFVTTYYSNISSGVALLNETPLRSIGKSYTKGSLGKYEKSNDVFYNFVSNILSGSSGGLESIGYYTDKGFGKENPRLVNVESRNCLASMPIKYPYNSIDFSYNPIIDISQLTPLKVLNDLRSDYIYIDDSDFFKDETSSKEDPCADICNSADSSLLTDGSSTTSKQYEEDCNKCQEEQRAKKKEEMKKSKSSGAGVGGYLYSDLTVNKDTGEALCTGMNPCVEIDRALAKGTGDDEGKEEMRYYVCQCSCEFVTYASYSCTRAGDSSEYFYTSCEQNDITSDQGGYMFSIHGFEAELFKNVLGNTENKMPMFMLGQGSTFSDYFAAKEKCVPEITADVTIVAGNEPITPKEIEVIEGSSICFRNDGSKQRTIYKGNELITVLNSSESICLATGKDTNFTKGSHNIYIDDNKIYAKLIVIEPSKAIVSSSIKKSENGDFKFFYNNEIELSLLYASSPFSVPLLDDESRSWNAYDTGEYSIDSNAISKYFSNDNTSLTWISYMTGVNSMNLSRTNVYSSKYDFNKDGYVDLIDLISCPEYEIMSGIQICSQMVNTYPYFKNIVSSNTNYDYPTIKKDTEYYEFNPGAIILPLNSDFCIYNQINKKVDLILERKINPSHSRNELSTLFKESGLIPSLSNVIFQTKYSDNVFSNHIKILSEKSFVYLDSLKNNRNYEFVEGKALYQGLECCFHLSEPGVYKVSSLTGEMGEGYVVVLPTDVGNTFVLNDYEYEPEYAVPKEGDFVCISNPYPFDRELTLSGSTTGTVALGASTETCSYDWAGKKSNNIDFYDKTTGAEFELEVTNSTILNIEILNSFFVQKTGKISPQGTVCFINKNEIVSNISIYALQKSGVTLNKKFILDGNSMECFSNYASGLYKVTISQSEDTLVMANVNDYYLTVANDNEGYIYNSSFYGSPVNIQLEDIDSLLSTEITSKKLRNIVIYNLDTFEYHLYTKISFDNRMGLLSSSYYIQTPEILFENTGNETLTVEVYNTNNLKSESYVIDSKDYKIHKYSEGDYQIEISGIFYPLTTNLDLGSYSGLLKTALLNSDRMLIQKGDTYYVDNSPKTFDYSPILIKSKLNFSVSTSITQSVNYGLESTVSKVSNPIGGLNSIVNVQMFDSPIVGSFVIDSVVNKKNIIEMQKLSGSVSNLDFGVQVLNDVPTSDILLQAKYMLAYDKSLPLFMYSRIGDVQIGVQNPSTTEIIYLPKGSNVSYVKSDWVSELSKIPPYIPANALVTSTENVDYGLNYYNNLSKDINFTIETLFTGVKKIIQVKATEPSKTVVMNYTEFKVVDDGKTGNKTYILNNLAYEPRAFNLRPTNAESYCIEFNGQETKPVNLNSAVNKTASSLMLYNINGSISEDLNDIKFHDTLHSANKIFEVSDITILPNYGITVSSINLKRIDAGQEIGYLYLEPEITINSGANIEKSRVSLNEGFISGLNETIYVRAYRFYGNSNQLKINVTPEVYDVNKYSVLSRVFPSEKVPGIETLLKVTNLYLRMKNVKAVPNKWYMAGLTTGNFDQLLKGSDTYFSELVKNMNEGKNSQWVDTGCGNSVLVVPFNNTNYPQVFAYDIPVSGASSSELKKNVDYSYTTNLNYPYAIQKVNSSSSFVLYNGEIINDVRIMMSENPNEATEICGYYNINNVFNSTRDFGSSYSNWEFTDDVCNKEDKNDFELDIDGYKIRFSDNNPDTTKEKSIIVYTPTGMYCGWGGGDGDVGDAKCNGANSPNCIGSYGLCTANKNCLDDFIGTKEDLLKIQNIECNEEFNQCIEDCKKSGTLLNCRAICIISDSCSTIPLIGIDIETDLDLCYDAIIKLNKKECDEDLEASLEEDEDCLGVSFDRLVDYNYGGFCSDKAVGTLLNQYLKENRDAFINCLNSKALANEDECAVGMGWDSMDEGKEGTTWWCRYNVDAFTHETQMFCSGKDCWNYLNVLSLATNKINIENQFDNGVSYNNVTYDFITGGYFDIFNIDSGTHKNTAGDQSICIDRGKGEDSLNDFYSNTNLTNDKGLSESASTYGLFFMLNSVDTGDYFFKNEISEDYVEKSKGYALSSSFDVQNTQGRKYLCVGAETYNGQDVILGPGGKEPLSLDLKANYQVYEPAYFTNFKMDEDRTFSHVSLFAHKPLVNYTLGNFNYNKPLTSGGYIEPEPEYNSVVNIYLYNLTTTLKNDDGSLSNFDVINLIKGETLTLQNVGDSEITWFYADDDVCDKGFTKLLNDRYSKECEKDNYKNCINNPTDYSVNPSDISEYLTKKGIKKVTVPKNSEIKIDASLLSVEGNYTEYLFFNPETGKRFKVIISNENYVVDININTFTQDSVNVFKNTNSRLCVRNYDFLSKDLILTSKSNPSNTKTISISSYGEYCLNYNELTSYYISDSILGRRLDLSLEDYSSATGNEKVSEVLSLITQKVTENNIASFNPAYGFLELNPGASATPAIITTEIIDYNTIKGYMNCEPGIFHLCLVEGDVGTAVANQVYSIVSNSVIKEETICEGTETIGSLPSGTLCGVGDSENEKAKTTEEIFDVSKIDCNEKVEIDGKIVYKLGTEEERKKCETTKKKLAERVTEIQNELNAYTIINEDKVLTMLPILIKFENGKTSLTESEVENIKDFIDDVNKKVDKLCDYYGNCDNKNEINDNCDDSYSVKNRYLDMIGFIVLIDDPGQEFSGNCSLMYNYLDGVMNISSYAASTNISEKGDIIRIGTPSMIVGLGINRSENVLESCWTDLEFKKEIESLFNTDFTIMLDKGIIGVGQYCLRDGECLPFSTNAKNGEDYGLYIPLNKDSGWSSFKPIEIPPIGEVEFNGLPPNEKNNCVLINGLYYCDPHIDVSKITSTSGTSTFTSSLINSFVGMSVPGSSGSSLGSITNTGLSSTIGTNLGGLLGSSFSGITLNPDLNLINPPIIIFPGLLSDGVKKEPYGKEWLDRCGRYYYNGDGMTMIVYPEKEIAEGQQGKSCNPGRMMEIYKKFNC